MDKVRKIGFWLIKNVLLFFMIYILDYCAMNFVGLKSSIFQVILLWLIVKVIFIPRKFSNK